MRVAIISSPRTGNTWLRSLLADACKLAELAIHNPADADWNALPRDCVLQIHWHRTASFCRMLQTAGFRVVTLTRHPLDVLVSILQFCQHDRSTLRWLDGEKGDERPVYGAMPGSHAFAAYATGGRAAALLSVSLQWWHDPDVCRLRYEELVADPVGQLGRLLAGLGEPARRLLADVVGQATVPGLRRRFRADHHFWQGRPGLWKTLLPTAIAQRIAAAHPDAFACRYTCDPDPQLTPEQADANWVALAGRQVADKLHTLTCMTQQLAAAQEALRQAQTTLDATWAELQKLRQKHDELYGRFHAASQELHWFHQLGPLPLAVALKLRNLSHRYRPLSAAAKGTLQRLAQWTGLARPAPVPADPVVTSPVATALLARLAGPAAAK
jgi:hypothetical protein